jgi:hypothetical protein
MIRIVLTGLWASMITVMAGYAAAYWQAGAPPPAPKEPYLEGLEFRKLPPITVPMIEDGAVEGYVLAKLVYTADAAHLRAFKLDPEAFIVDEAFSEIYVNGKLTAGSLRKYDLDRLLEDVKQNVNKRIGSELVQEVLVEEINYAGPQSEPGKAAR